MKRVIQIIMSLLIILSISSFFLYKYAVNRIEQGKASDSELQLYQSVPLIKPLKLYLSKLESQNKLAPWLHLAKYVAKKNAETALELGQYYQLNMQENIAEIWFKQAIRLGSVRARLSLAQQYFNIKDYAKTNALLKPISDNDTAFRLLLELAVLQGDTEFLRVAKPRLLLEKYEGIYKKLKYYNVIELDGSSAQNVDSRLVKQGRYFSPSVYKRAKGCEVELQLFSTSLQGLEHAESLRVAFQSHGLYSFICINTPTYIAKPLLDCKYEKNERIQCDAALWREKNVNGRYVGLVLEQGGANVNNGFLYIDYDDTVEVFSHEISHLLGFIDEYELPDNHMSCSQPQNAPFSHNISVLLKAYSGSQKSVREFVLSQLAWKDSIKPSTPILTNDKGMWKLGTPFEFTHEIGLFPSLTCNTNENIQAFKPSYTRTQLQYYEEAFPRAYIDILNKDSTRFLMPSYHYNVSQSLVDKGNYEEARKLLNEIVFD